MDSAWIWMILILATIVGRRLLKRRSAIRLATKAPEFTSGDPGQNAVYAPYQAPVPVLPEDSSKPKLWWNRLRTLHGVHLAVVAAILIYAAHYVLPYYPSTPVSNSPLAVDPGRLHGSGRIYLIQMGPHREDAYNLGLLTEWLRDKYGLDARNLRSMDLDRSAWNSWRRQYKAEALLDQLGREHPDLANDPEAYLFGVTDADMYTIWTDWRSTFTQREGRRAVLSSAHLEPDLGERLALLLHGPSAHHLDVQAQMRRILLKDVAVLFWRLPANRDPHSVLSQPMDPDSAPEEIYPSDLQPEKEPWGRYSTSPCVFFTYSSTTGMKPMDGPLVRECDYLVDSTQYGETSEVFRLDLRYGALVDLRTDFEVPGTLPLRFTRGTRSEFPFASSMGPMTSHSYDRELSSQDMGIVQVIEEGGPSMDLKRFPPGRGFLGPFAKYVPLTGSYATLRWRSRPFGHFELERPDGSVEQYFACGTNTPPCYLTGFRSSSGEVLRFERDAKRKLLSVTAPNGNFLHFDYDNNGHLVAVTDNRGRVVNYAYDGENRLASVSYPSGEVLSYEYDSLHRLVALYAAPAPNIKPKLLLRNEFQNGFLTSQTLADGRAFRYAYSPLDKMKVQTVIVRPPTGPELQVWLYKSSAAVREVSE